MALALTLSKRIDGFGGPVVLYNVVASGSYATGGDVASIAALTPGTGSVPIAVIVVGQGGFFYQWVAGASQALGKIKVFIATTTGGNIPQAEHSAAAYAGGVTGDVITAIAFFGPT